MKLVNIADLKSAREIFAGSNPAYPTFSIILKNKKIYETTFIMWSEWIL